MENQALIAALEQARSALDAVEVAASQGRKDRLSKPAAPAAESEACPNCGKPEADCTCEDEASEME